MLSQDSFYRGLTEEEKANVQAYNFDHPDSVDFKAIVDCLEELKGRKIVEVPEYDFKTHSRSAITRRVPPADVVIIEGILVLHMEEIRSQLNMKVFVDTDDDVRLARRIQRDVAERGRDVEGVIQQYTKFVKPAFDQFIAPSRRHADIIIPWQRLVPWLLVSLLCACYFLGIVAYSQCTVPQDLLSFVVAFGTGVTMW